jgi:simple sugar transport system ATP-binding protein
VPPILQAHGITKRFSQVLANDAVDFTAEAGKVHVLLGENGAGKTTLMNILYGLEKPDAGEIWLEGKPIQLNSPKDAIRQGILMVHQHFMLVPVFSVIENIVLGVEQTSRASWLGELGVLDKAKSRRQIQLLAKQLSLNVDLDARISDLPVGVQQKVEIIKALYRGARLLILDEPTAVLTPSEVTELFELLRTLSRQGLAIVLITHKLKESLAIANRISVMRQGRMVGTLNPTEATEATLAEMMVGRKVVLQIAKPPAHVGSVALHVQELRVLDDRRHLAVDRANLTLHMGEILGIAGVQGNGQTELVEALAGLRPVTSGRVELFGQDCTNATPREWIELGLAHIPEDRGKNGIVKPYSIADNAVLCTYYKPPYARGIQIQPRAVRQQATELIQMFDIRPANPRYRAGSLSGGNQQKLIVARELSRGAKLLIASQPTRGVDIGAIELIHRQIIAARDRGVAVLLISSELDEILALSDRVAVMYRGTVIETSTIAETNREKLGRLMAGIA